MPQKHSLAGNRRYQLFVRARNKALEKLHIAAQLKISAIIHEALLGVKDIARGRYNSICRYGIYSPEGQQEVARLQFDINRMFSLAIPHMAKIMKDLRKQVYTLAYAGESEAIGQALGYKTTYNLPNSKVVQKANSETFTGGTVEDRVQLTINRLVRRIMNTIELSAVNEEEEHIFYAKLKAILPKPKTVAGEQRNVSVGPKLREAESIGPKEDMSVGFIDEETWDEMLDTYKEEFVPTWRGPDSSYSVKTEAGEKETLYAWELEKEVTQDFVYQVRSGQVDAAKENGINDYVWVAVVDSRTDDCCLWRDGLTTAEIERRLKTDRAEDECQSIVPPAHFNCRCVLAPMVEEMPEAPEENIKEFEDWLNT